MASAFNKFESFVGAVGLEKHELNADAIMAILTNTLPTAALDTYSQVSGNELATGNGYTAGGKDIQNLYSESGGIGTMTATDVVWTATGAVGPFQYVVLYNDTAPAKELVGWYDYASSISLANTETFTLDFGASVLTIE